MTLYSDITTAWKDAMKARDPKKDTLAMIRTEVKNKVINSRTTGSTAEVDPADDLVVEVLNKMAKTRKESIVEYKNGGRQDLVDKESSELAVVMGFLPKQLTPEEIAAIAKEAIAESGATTIKDMGKAMKLAMSKIAGRADGKDVQAEIKLALGGMI